MKYLITTNHPSNLKHITEGELRTVKQFLEDNHVWFIDYVFELGKTRQLHMHAVVKYYGKWKPLIKFAEFRIHWTPIHDMDGAIRYLTKQVCCQAEQDQILAENDYHIYRFVKTPSI